VNLWLDLKITYYRLLANYYAWRCEMVDRSFKRRVDDAD